jgi:hypothetical protein
MYQDLDDECGRHTAEAADEGGRPETSSRLRAAIADRRTKTVRPDRPHGSRPADTERSEIAGAVDRVAAEAGEVAESDPLPGADPRSIEPLASRGKKLTRLLLDFYCRSDCGT